MRIFLILHINTHKPFYIYELGNIIMFTYLYLTLQAK